MRQAETVGGRSLRPGDEDRCDDPDLTLGRALGGTVTHANRLAAASHSSRPSIGMT